jgi:hypothetical protein
LRKSGIEKGRERQSGIERRRRRDRVVFREGETEKERYKVL